MKLFLLKPGRQLVEECLLFLCSILEQPPSHRIPHPHCFLPNYNYRAINLIKQSKKKRNTNELKADKRKEKRSSKPSEKNGFIPGGGGFSWKIWVWLFRWGLAPPPLQRRTNSNNLLPQLYNPSPGPHLSPAGFLHIPIKLLYSCSFKMTWWVYSEIYNTSIDNRKATPRSKTHSRTGQNKGIVCVRATESVFLDRSLTQFLWYEVYDWKYF